MQFATTQPTPTYLLAWTVGPLEVVEAPDITPNAVRTRPLPLRGVAVKGKGELLAYALSETPALLAALEEYFGTPYPFEKLDVVTVPDFAPGAMENTGLITFREWLLLVDPKNAAEGQLRAFTGVMTHELAHMWFGNLVTMPWWNDIWLNEAFATWLATKVQSKLHPEHHAEDYALGKVLGAMGTDSLKAARRIRQPVVTSGDIDNAFDGITYSKGGAVLSMFEAYLGEDTFREGVRA